MSTKYEGELVLPDGSRVEAEIEVTMSQEQVRSTTVATAGDEEDSVILEEVPLNLTVEGSTTVTDVLTVEHIERFVAHLEAMNPPRWPRNTPLEPLGGNPQPYRRLRWRVVRGRWWNGVVALAHPDRATVYEDPDACRWWAVVACIDAERTVVRSFGRRCDAKRWVERVLGWRTKALV